MAAPKPRAATPLKPRETVTFASIPDGMVGKVLGELATSNAGRLVYIRSASCRDRV